MFAECINKEAQLQKAPTSKSKRSSQKRYYSSSKSSNIRLPNLPIIQPKLIIKDRNATFSPYSKNMKEFYETVIVSWLNQCLYKSYGIMKQFRDFVSTDHEYQNDSAFLNAFAIYLSEQKRTVRGGDTIPVLRPFSISSMSRPTWPKELKERLQAKANVQEGGNIRHVIRNYSLKKALDIFYQRAGASAMCNLAEQLGINMTQVKAFDAYVRAIYKKLYLNIDNLWFGDGFVNQMIGFLATPLSDYGQAIIHGEKSFDPNTLEQILFQHTEFVRGRHERKVAFLREIYDVIVCFAGNIMNNLNINFNEEIGSIIDDIGLNFGFDLIDDQSDDILIRQERLLEAEMRLQKYISSNGAEDNLCDIFKLFLNINQPNAIELDFSDPDQPLEPCITPASTNESTAIKDIPKELFALALNNNHLIYATANALDISLPIDVVIRIRMELHSLELASIGDILNVADEAIRFTILNSLCRDYNDYTFRIFDLPKNKYVVYPPNGNLVLSTKYIDIVYDGNYYFTNP